MKNYKVILIALLLGISIISIFKYATTLKERYALLEALNQAKTQAATLQNEKQNLLQLLEKEKESAQVLTKKNEQLKDALRASKRKIIKADAELDKALILMEKLNFRATILKTENDILRKDQEELKGRLAQANKENETLKARLSSVTELKKAIRELKGKPARPRPLVLKEEKINPPLFVGNQGYLIKNGVSTHSYVPRVKIEVDLATENK